MLSALVIAPHIGDADLEPMRVSDPSCVCAVMCLLVTSCGTVQRDEPAPFVQPTARLAAEAADEPAPEAAGPGVSKDVLEAARTSLGVAGLSFGNAVLQACPGVVPPRFDYDTEKMWSALDSSLEGLGRCSAAGRLAQSQLLLLVWDSAAGEALRALLVQSGTPASRLVVELQSADREGGGEWVRQPKVRVEVRR